MPLDENIWFHRQIAYSILLFTTIHTTAHCKVLSASTFVIELILSPPDVNFYNVEVRQLRVNTALGIHYTQPGGFTGHIMLIIMVLMYVKWLCLYLRSLTISYRYTTAHSKIRHQNFELFWYTHHLA